MVLNEALTPRRRCLFATRMTEGLYTEFCPSASTSSLSRQARLPHILSLQEITQRSRDVDDALCDRCTRAEAAHLRVGDVHSRMMVAHILGGKGNRHRDVMLSAKLLTVLREYSPANEFDAPVPCSSFDGVVRIDRMGCSESSCLQALWTNLILLCKGALHGRGASLR